MSAFFGIEELNAQNYIERGMFCIPNHLDGTVDTHAIVSPIRCQDVVFIKHYESNSTMHIKAIGIVQSEYSTVSSQWTCVPVDWVWQGEKEPLNVDEAVPLSSQPFYEEHNILIQHEIDELIPKKYRLPQTW